MSDTWTSRLSEYLDNELGPDERGRLERHLADCAECRQVLEQLRQVVHRAFTLPDREPDSDVWPQVSEAIAAGRVVPFQAKRPRRFAFTVPQLAAAAAALVVLAGAGAWFASGSLRRPEAPGTGGGLIPVAAAFDPGSRADSAITELERILREESSRLDTSTVRILAENLALIDRAIAQARQALEQDPGNPYLNEHLARTMRKKIEVLRQAAELAAVAS